MHRRPFTTQDAYSRGVTHAALKHGLSQGRIQRVLRGIYIEGADPVTPVETALAALVATSGVASGALAGVLHGLDSVRLQGKLVTIPTERDSRLAAVQRADLEPQQTVTIDGYRCTNGAQTMIGLAVILNDLQWEQALESALHKRLLRVEDLGAVSDFRGSKRIRRVLALRPPGVPPTESLLETLMVQLIRTESLLPTPQRQVVVLNKWDRFVARVDLAWPEHGTSWSWTDSITRINPFTTPTAKQLSSLRGVGCQAGSRGTKSHVHRHRPFGAYVNSSSRHSLYAALRDLRSTRHLRL